MSDTRDAFGPLLQRLQTDMTSLRSDMRSLRSEQTALREYLVSFIGARASETEAMIERLFEHLNKRLDQSERSLDERLTRIEERR
jgi:DNA anti-recombination protein RmuC